MRSCAPVMDGDPVRGCALCRVAYGAAMLPPSGAGAGCNAGMRDRRRVACGASMLRLSGEVGGRGAVGPGVSLIVLFAIMAAGCRGGGNVEFVSLNVQSVDPPAARSSRFPLDRCTWWMDEQNRVWLAMQRIVPTILGEKYRLVLQITLRLDKPPAGKARNYAIGTDALRAVAHFGPAESRFTSTAGSLALYRDGADRFRGGFRVEAGRHARELLTGWSKPAKYLLLCEFVAVPDDGRGREIVAATESDGFERADAP